MAYLALSVTGVVHRVWIETFKLVWGEEDASLMAFDLCKEVLLLVVMCWCHIAFSERILTENGLCEKQMILHCAKETETAFLVSDRLPSMPMSSRLDVSCPQFLWACCLLIQFQLKPRKSTTIFFPTVSFRVCWRYTLENVQEKSRAKCMRHFVLHSDKLLRIYACLQHTCISANCILFRPPKTI